MYDRIMHGVFRSGLCFVVQHDGFIFLAHFLSYGLPFFIFSMLVLICILRLGGGGELEKQHNDYEMNMRMKQHQQAILHQRQQQQQLAHQQQLQRQHQMAHVSTVWAYMDRQMSRFVVLVAVAVVDVV